MRVYARNIVMMAMWMFAVAAFAQPPVTNSAYPFTTSVVAKVGATVTVPPSLLGIVLDPGGPFPDVAVCSYVAAPVGEDDTAYGDITDAPAGIEYTVAVDWWNQPGVLTCEGFNETGDVVWYSAESVLSGAPCSDDPTSPNLGTFYFNVDFEPDLEDNTPIVADYPRYDTNGVACSETCIDGTTCLDLYDLFEISYTNMAAMFDDTRATPLYDIFIKTDPSFTIEGACFDVYDRNSQLTTLWKACYTAGTDCVNFIKNDDATEEELIAGSPYTFTIAVTNQAGGESTFDVTLSYPCTCCAKTKKLLELEVVENGPTVTIPWTQWFDDALCGEGLSNDYQIVTSSSTIQDALWQNVWGGWQNGSADVLPSTNAVRERLLAQQAFEYTPPRFGYVVDCDYQYDWFYIRTTCFTNINYGSTNPPVWSEVSFDQTQVRIKVMDACNPEGLTATTNSYNYNTYEEPVTDPCGFIEEGGFQPLCMGEYSLNVCTLLSETFINVALGDSRRSLYISSIGYEGVANTTKLGGTVYITPGDQSTASVIYSSPMDLTETAEDEYHYTVVDLQCGSVVTQKATIVVEPCTVAECVIDSDVIKIDVCVDGEQHTVTAEDILGAVQWPEFAEACGVDIESACWEYIDVATGCDLQGSWRAWPSAGCPPGIVDCEESCVQQFVYTAVPSAFARPGTDRFTATVSYYDTIDDVTRYLEVEVRFVVRPVSEGGPLTVDVIGDGVMQDGGAQIALVDLKSAIFANLSGIYGSPVIDEDGTVLDDANIIMALSPVSLNGGVVSVECTSPAADPVASLLWIDCEDCPGDCLGDSPEECFTDIGLDADLSVDADMPSCSVMLSPAAGFIGTDVIEYYVWDGSVAECGGALNVSTGTISVEVIRNLLSPIAVDDQITAYRNEQLFVDIVEENCNFECAYTLAEGSILGNDRWASGAKLVLEVLSSPANGLFNFRADGTVWSFSYLPNSGFTGIDTFVYRIYDSVNKLYSQPATVTLVVSDLNAVSRTPTLSWPSVTLGADWYNVWLGRRPYGSDESVAYTPFYNEWVQDANSWTPNTGLPGGDYSVYVRTWSTNVGMSGWTEVSMFSIETATPGEVELLSPSGLQQARNLNYTWTKDGNATWYRLWIGRNGVRMADLWHADDGVGVASKVINGHPSQSSYEWYVRPWGPDGLAPTWSGPQLFERD